MQPTMSVRNMALENFDCEGDPIAVALRWEKWKAECRAYLRDNGIQDSTRKKAMLLQMGGLALQDIYYNRTWPLLSRTFLINNVFEIALNRLDKYFAPKNNVLYERYIFRSMKQNPREAFMRFLERIEKQSEKCNFTDPNAQIIDQIVDKCVSYKLKEKIVAMNSEATIHKISSVAQALEAERRPMSCSAACRNKLIDTFRQFYWQPDYDFLNVYDDNKCCACGKLFNSNNPRPQCSNSAGNVIPNQNIMPSSNVNLSRNAIPGSNVNLNRNVVPSTTLSQYVLRRNIIPREFRIPLDTTIVKIEDDKPAKSKNIKATSTSVDVKAELKTEVPSSFSINLRSRVQRNVPVDTNVDNASNIPVKSSKAKVEHKVPAKSKKTNAGRKTSVKSKNIKKTKGKKRK